MIISLILELSVSRDHFSYDSYTNVASTSLLNLYNLYCQWNYCLTSRGLHIWKQPTILLKIIDLLTTSVQYFIINVYMFRFYDIIIKSNTGHWLLLINRYCVSHLTAEMLTSTHLKLYTWQSRWKRYNKLL